MAAKIYDYVVVGGGTAGLVLANRLTENDNVHVLVLEAGEDLTADPRVTTPALFPTLLGSDADWNTVTEPQTALYGKAISLPHGRALGGSSAINGQAFVPTSKFGIDMWGEFGNQGWSWEALAQYFQKSHTLLVPKDPAVHQHFHLDYINPKLSGKEGPIRASFPSATDNPLPDAWIKTLQALGHKATGDPFSGEIVGAYTNAASIDPETSQRSYAASAYLDPIRDRTNLTVVTGAYVQKLELAGDHPEVRCEEVRYFCNGETKTAKVSSEVILAAGALHTPQLLELSGIGDPTRLSALGIHTHVANKYVGENLQDQPMTGLSFEVKDHIQTIDNLLRQDPTALKAAMDQYATSRSGPLAVGGIFSYAFLGLQHKALEPLQLPSSFPDEHPLYSDQVKYLARLLQNAEESTAAFFTYAAQGNFGSGSGSSLMQLNFLPGNYYSVAVCLLQPLSRGCVHIRTANPSDAPVVDPRYLTHPLDLELFARHLTYISNIVSTEPLASLLKHEGRRNASAPSDLTNLDSMREYVRKTTLSSWHPTSTCAMLPLEKGGVVNERLVVHGTRNLRVVDASIFPLTTRGNPVATVYAVAERAADLIKEDLQMHNE